MNGDTLIRQLAGADVYAPDHDLPETARTSTVALTEIRRRIDMDAKELTKPIDPEQPRQRRGLVVAAITFAGIVLIAGLVSLLSDRDAVEPASEPVATTQAITPTTVGAAATTTTVAPSVAELEVTADEQAVLDAFVAAVNTANPNTIEALLAPGFVTTSSDDMRSNIEADGSFAALFHAYYASEGSVFALDACRAVEAGIQCESTWSGVVPRAVFGVDFTGRETITIVDGRIQSIRHTPRQWPSTLPWLTQARLDLIEWVRTINPEDATTMESGEESYGGFRLEVGPLWETYAEQWLEAGRP